MTGEQFHDALTLLPEDLVAQADSFRQKPPNLIRWKRYAALAACFAVLLVSFAFVRNTQEVPAKMTAAAPSPAAEAEAPDAAAPDLGVAPEAASGTLADSAIPFVCVETPDNLDNTACFAHGPSATPIVSRDELDAYLSKWDKLYLMEALRDACAGYNADWFASHDLLLIPVDNVSTGQACTVTDVTIADGACEITLTLNGEETEESTNYHIVFPVDKGAVSDPQNITVIYGTSE